ncbi:type II protein arginine N-methyltransferase Skb1 [Protomyces lactucae-debilis]|uniref:Protein arginine N-methyltransferase n=1 Tax=Protomyces lactucae-debilis TaxID=2754530 RepID=A0A1Y2FQV0_PROLT|nr:type II protein arginine N-methyltransferase Skb1 [Protomyces lactucae-debilis]ORY85586.1 type II protein arginine N-methyltransferase Skb1 [Protomyces lactucae-debilis]
MLEIGVCSQDSLESLHSRGYAFNVLDICPDEVVDQAGVALVACGDLHSIDSLIRQDSIDKFVNDIGFTQFHGMHQVCIQGPQSQQDALVFAQSIAPVLEQHTMLELSILLPLCPAPLLDQSNEIDDNTLSTWHIWDTIRSACCYDHRLHVALQLPTRLPSETTRNRWLCEDVRMIFISANIFLVNSKGYPVLPKAHQSFIGAAARYSPALVLQDIDRHQRLGGDDAYLQYLRYVLKNVPEPTPAEASMAGYRDFLQTPLQPLQDNLPSATYEVFERDLIKYNQYELAITRALLDRPHDERTIVAVVGAGRGPLVDCALRAAESSEHVISLMVIEKNPHAVLGLKRRLKHDWAGLDITLFETDMRDWNTEEYVHILVSELLGSFADNELSPECLDGIQDVLCPETGVSIPCRYTPFVSPLMAPKLHTTLLRSSETTALETPYVVLLDQCCQLSTGFEPLWHFHHPHNNISLTMNIGANKCNKRFGRVTFEIEAAGVCHGIAGYFESILYDDVELSTVPDTIALKSPEMQSWFPIFFPLKTAIQVPAESTMEVCFWRETDGKKVWYEYCVEILYAGAKIYSSAIHNRFGRANAALL